MQIKSVAGEKPKINIKVYSPPDGKEWTLHVVHSAACSLGCSTWRKAKNLAAINIKVFSPPHLTGQNKHCKLLHLMHYAKKGKLTDPNKEVEIEPILKIIFCIFHVAQGLILF